MFSYGRVKELEDELKEVRAAFAEFVESSKALEDGLDKELSEMNQKLSASANANEALEKQLQRMQPMLGELENSLNINKQKLKEESQLRKQAETSQAHLETLLKEAESRSPANENTSAMRQEKDSLREECEALRKELQSKNGQVEAYKQQAVANRRRLEATRSRISGGKSITTSNPTGAAVDNSTALPDESKLDTSFAEVFDELESVAEQLVAAQNKLQEAELHSSGKLSLPTNDNGDLQREVQSLRETTNLAQHELERLQVKLEESNLENSTLVEEIACLREVLQDKTEAEATREDIAETIRMTVMAETKEQHAQELAENQKKREKEITILREKLKVIVKENATLRQAVDQLQSGVPSYAHKGEINRWKNEVNQLKESIALLKEEHATAIEDLEKEMEDRLARASEDMQGDMIEASSEAVSAMKDEIEELSIEKLRLEETVDQLEATVQRIRGENTELAENTEFAESLLSKTRDELLKLKKTAGTASADLEYTKRSLKKAEAEVDKVSLEYAEACAELEVARQILDEAGLDEETIAREDEIELKKQIHSLSKSLEQMRQEYTDLENDFLDSQHRFCDSQEEASRKSEDEIMHLTRKINELEEALDRAKTENGNMFALMEQTKQEGGIQTSKINNASLEQELKETKSQLEELQAENIQLKADLKELKDQSTIQVKVLDSFINSKVAVPESKRAEDGEGVEVITTPSQENLKPWYSRDPPTSRGNLFGYSIRDKTMKLLSASLKTKQEATISRTGSSDTSSDASDSVVDENIMDQIKSLQVALEEAEHGSVRLEEMTQRLALAETKLVATEEELTRTSDENGALKIEVLALKDAVKEARGDLEKTKTELLKVKNSSLVNDDTQTKLSPKPEGFNELQAQLKQLADEKAALQHQLDDSKIALSVSHYAQERSKEELRFSESQLLASTDDTQRLRHELQSMSRSLADMKHEYDGVVAELRGLRNRDTANNVDSSEAPEPFAQQLQQLSLENNDLRQAVQEFEDALEQSRKEVEDKSRQITSLHDALLSTQDETKLLTKEISQLTNAFDTVKAEYNTVVDELETVNELFDEARDEAERNGKDAAVEQSRQEMIALRDEERRVMGEQVRRVLEENASLQKQVHDVQTSLTEAHSMKKTGQEISMIKTEVCALKDSLRNSEEEIKALREKEMTLNLELKNSLNELKLARSELALAHEAIEQSRVPGDRAVPRDLEDKEEHMVVAPSAECGQEIAETSSDVGNRVSTAEENASRQESEPAVAPEMLEVTEAGLFILRKKQASDKTGRAGQDGQDCPSTEENSTIQHPIEGRQASESREEESVPRAKTATLPSGKEKSLTSRALEAIAQSKKKNTLRKFAQDKIQGALAAHMAQQNKDTPELVGSFATNSNME
eukprot:Nitzschia sp. Nitz4//scaffold8_size234185//75858//80080//NITZ4_001250-RA/size234185-augustus-gene-0.260-mRNA-1//-1//CDS//3329559785//4501//frame0